MVRERNTFLTGIRHPEYLEDEMYWYDWRDTYNGGPRYLRRNLKKFSDRESDQDFKFRAFNTPIPTFAKSAVNDVRNSIFQRLRDVSRRGGSENYKEAVAGEKGGVDNKGSSMQQFLGIDVLTELLIMGRVGVYVDMPTLQGLTTMADEGNARPYCYYYRVEDILSWAVAKPEEPGDYTAVLLRDRAIDYNQGFAYGASLPCGGYLRYRYMWINPFTRKVNMRIFDEEENLIDMHGRTISDRDGFEREMEINSETDFGVFELDLERIPFTQLTIGGSLLKDVYKHQVALLNLGSSDVAYALRANIPIYVEQRDMRAVGQHLKKAVADDGTTVTSDNSEPGEESRTGVSYGRTYDLKAEQPAFIHPSAEPLKASMGLQEKLEDDIRKLVNLAVQNKMGQRAISAEAMKLSDQGLEAGLSFIGLVLEGAERQIASFWSAYENKDPGRREIATVKYPDRYSLKNDEDRVKEAKELADLMYTVPGRKVKAELAKNIVTALLSGKVDTATIEDIFSQIDDANYATSDPETIIRSYEAGLVDGETASVAIGFDPESFEKAQEEQIERAEAIMAAQGQGGKGQENMAARGVPDLDTDTSSGQEEREKANDTSLEPEEEDRTRGEGKSLEKGD